MAGLFKIHAKLYLEGHILIFTKRSYGAFKSGRGVWITLKPLINSTLQRKALKDG